jgi:plasmid stabilization system protein ParE
LNKPLRISRQFYRDIDVVLGYLGTVASADVVRRFASAVESTRGHIKQFPSSGRLQEAGDSNIDNLRVFPVSKYPDYLLFYIDGPEEVVLVRLLHGKRDIGVELDGLDVE